MTETILSRKEREQLRRRRHIIDTAMKLFNKEGYQNVSMHEIARQSEFAIATLYKFFKNKEELYKAIILGVLEKSNEITKPIWDSDLDEVTKLRTFFFTFADRIMEEEESWSLLTRESRGTSFSIRTGMDEDLSRFLEHIRAEASNVFASGIKRGFFAAKDPYYLAVALLAVLETAMLLIVDDPEHHPYPRTLELMFDIFFAKILIN